MFYPKSSPVTRNSRTWSIVPFPTLYTLCWQKWMLRCTAQIPLQGWRTLPLTPEHTAKCQPLPSASVCWVLHSVEENHCDQVCKNFQKEVGVGYKYSACSPQQALFWEVILAPAFPTKVAEVWLWACYSPTPATATCYAISLHQSC